MINNSAKKCKSQISIGSQLFKINFQSNFNAFLFPYSYCLNACLHFPKTKSITPVPTSYSLLLRLLHNFIHLNLRNTRTLPQPCVSRSTFYIASWYWLRDLVTKYQNLIPLEKRLKFARYFASRCCYAALLDERTVNLNFCQVTNNNDNNDSNEEDHNDNIKHTLDR